MQKSHWRLGLSFHMLAHRYRWYSIVLTWYDMVVCETHCFASNRPWPILSGDLYAVHLLIGIKVCSTKPTDELSYTCPKCPKKPVLESGGCGTTLAPPHFALSPVWESALTQYRCMGTAALGLLETLPESDCNSDLYRLSLHCWPCWWES